MSTAINLTNCHVAKEPSGDVALTIKVPGRQFWGARTVAEMLKELDQGAVVTLANQDALKLRDWLNEQFPEKR